MTLLVFLRVFGSSWYYFRPCLDLSDDFRSHVNDVRQQNLATTCGCIVLDVSKLKQCSACGGLACHENNHTNHTVACQACRLWACVRCQVWTELEQQPVVLCPACAERLTATRLHRAIRWLLGGR